jgi:hypothetical protein
MSLVNLIGNLVCPEYPTMFVVENNELEYLRQCICAQGMEDEFYVNGTVGKLIEGTEDAIQHAIQFEMEEYIGRWQDVLTQAVKKTGPVAKQMLRYNVGTILAAIIPLAIIGGISQFQNGHSTHTQRAWTMTWLVFGMITGITGKIAWFSESWRQENSPLHMFRSGRSASLYDSFLFIPFILIFYSAPAIGGFVVVGKMIREYGVCTELS